MGVCVPALATGPAVAADVAKVGTCLLGNCQVALAKCLADGECLENLVCLQLCNGRKDETECQVLARPAPAQSGAVLAASALQPWRKSFPLKQNGVVQACA